MMKWWFKYQTSIYVWLGVYHNCLQEYVAFKQRHVFSFKYEINTLFSGEKGHFEGLELFERAEYIINMYTPKFKEIWSLLPFPPNIVDILCCNGYRKLNDILVPLS